MLVAAIAFMLLVFLVLALFAEACGRKQGASRRIPMLLGVEALEDRVVPALSIHSIKARIAAEFPAVADPHTPDIVRVSLLRTWAFQEADFGNGKTRLDKQAKIDYYDRSLPELVRLFDNDAGGVQGAGDAYFLRKLYQAYSYRSGELTVGILHHGTNTVTLVQVSTGNGHTTTLLEDASTDCTAVDADGNPMNVKVVARMAREGRANEVYWQGGENSGRDLLLSTQDRDTALAGNAWSFDPATDSPDATMARHGLWKLHAGSHGDRLENMWWERTAAPFIASRRPELPPVFASTFAFAVRVKGVAGKIFAHSLPAGTMRHGLSMTMRDVKARIAAEFPAMADPSTSDVVRVGLLRTWAFEQVDLGDGSIPLDTRPEIDYYHLGIVDLLKLFDKDEGSVLCGGTAYFLMKLYQSYGYISGRMSVGFLPAGNHTVTLVQVRMANGNTNTLIEDAYTDITPVDANGDPIGAKQVAKLAHMGRADEVFWEAGNDTGRDLLVSAAGRDADLRGSSWAFDPATDAHDVVMVRPGVYKLHAGHHAERMIWKWWDRAVAPSIKKNRPGMPLVLASTFAFPLWVQGTAGLIFANSLPPGNLQILQE